MRIRRLCAVARDFAALWTFGVLWTTGAAASGPTLLATDTAGVPLRDWLNGSLELLLPTALRPPAPNTVTPRLLKADAGLDTWQQESCALPPTGDRKIVLTNTTNGSTSKCSEILTALWSRGGKFVLAVNNEFLSFEIAKADRTSTHVHDLDLSGSFKHPPWVAPNSRFYAANVAGSMKEFSASHDGILPAGLVPILEKLPTDGSQGITIYYVVDDKIVQLTYSVKKGNKNTSAGAVDIELVCDGWRDYQEGLNFSGYVVCMDTTTPGRPTTVVKTTSTFTDGEAQNGHLWTNTPIRILVTRRVEQVAHIKLGGTPGRTSTVYIQEKRAMLASEKRGPDAADLKLPEGVTFSTADAAARTPASAPTLDVSINERNADGSLKEVAKYSFDFYVEREYSAAVRAGLAFLYGPLDAKYDVESTTGNNAGHEIIREQLGIPSFDMSVGVSFFTGQVGEFTTSPSFSWYIGLSFVTANASGADVFTSVYTGPEVSFGKDFSVALALGMRRTEKLEEDLQVHSAVTTDDIDDHTVPWVSPVIGLMANLSPYVWSVGR